MTGLKTLLSDAVPRVVGTVSTMDALRNAAEELILPCDIVEVRLDEVDAPGSSWLAYCEAIEAKGTPVIVTIRTRQEGGKWKEDESKREKLFRAAIGKVSALDIELSSSLIEALSHEAANSNTALVCSYHDLNMTSPFDKLSDIVRRANATGAAVIKIATLVNRTDDAEVLMRLLRHHTNGTPLCVIGMGSEAVWTRLSFPAMGSCLTYGYLDRNSALGQLPCCTLVSLLRATLPAFNEGYVIRKRILEYV